MSVRIFTNPGTGKPRPKLTDARTTKKNHDEQEGERGTRVGGGRDKEMGKEEEETKEENMNNNEVV